MIFYLLLGLVPKINYRFCKNAEVFKKPGIGFFEIDSTF
ncbi:hypothetical protein LEP1GSC021_1988 [Leptospira noguchii str. 1993005606]|uniref:Uncharacterized protein n=2 Tax=Leptospira noguchii TaxID=28182 RepID=T0GQ13_9LEPT|nr:hypothetical protein LEP1GSC041_1540 [Leptospira noguchii str. 2006001870]EMI61185.1 hypothetical protein LEP1GSC072_3673 [Leptospira noguchii str. Bonito]EMO55777.1 hypothetical protein LEP1GSC172_0471 [Leptospira noguchii]EPE86452.1 hypothetical protein LEP1GSC021_1988 [Leptospira noguchii str. 1993005606]EQA70982.1 hypothetical protein LEP1GSC059_3107 [Leptospira noguchii serovar Panama str. CZ214]